MVSIFFVACRTDVTGINVVAASIITGDIFVASSSTAIMHVFALNQISTAEFIIVGTVVIGSVEIAASFDANFGDRLLFVVSFVS